VNVGVEDLEKKFSTLAPGENVFRRNTDSRPVPPEIVSAGGYLREYSFSSAVRMRFIKGASRSISKGGAVFQS
jgi:hypothetical protein